MSCKNKYEVDSDDRIDDDKYVRLVKITGFPEVMVYLPGRARNAVLVGDGIEFDYEQEGIGRNNWFEYDSLYDPTLLHLHRSGFTVRRVCRATVLLDWGIMGRNGMGIPSRLTLAMAVEGEVKRRQQREEQERQEKIDWWTRYAQLPVWGVSAGFAGGMLQNSAS